MRVTISDNNTKMGNIPSVSLSQAACPAGVPCRKHCYAGRFCNIRPGTAASYAANYAVLTQEPTRYFLAVRGYLAASMPPVFRWHVCGDIPSQSYLDTMKTIAREYPGTLFFTFTKNHGLDFSRLPRNLSVIASVWPGWGDVESLRIKGLPIAWVRSADETRIPETALPCPGHCESCARCAGLSARGLDVVFKKR